MGLWISRLCSNSCTHMWLGDRLRSYPGTWVINQVSFYLLPPCSLWVWTVHLTVFFFLAHFVSWVSRHQHNFCPAGPSSLICWFHVYVVFSIQTRVHTGRISVLETCTLSVGPRNLGHQSASFSPSFLLSLLPLSPFMSLYAVGHEYGVMTRRRGGLHGT